MAKRKPAKKSEALVIVHLSSMDALAADAASGMDRADIGTELAESLGYEICRRASEHRGPVYVIDQAWSAGRRESRPRERLMTCLEQKRPDARWILFDENGDDEADPVIMRRFRHERLDGRDGNWSQFLPRLHERLQRDGVRRAVVGGLWRDPRGKSGCATKVAGYLHRQMPTRIDEDITADEDWVANTVEEREIMEEDD